MILRKKQHFIPLHLMMLFLCSVLLTPHSGAHSRAHSQRIVLHHFYLSQDTRAPVYFSADLPNMNRLDLAPFLSLQSRPEPLASSERLLVVRQAESYDQTVSFQPAGLELHPGSFLPDQISCTLSSLFPGLLPPMDIDFYGDLIEIHTLQGSINPRCSQIKTVAGNAIPFDPATDYGSYPDNLWLIEIPPEKPADQERDSGRSGIPGGSNSKDLKELLSGSYGGNSGFRFDFKPGGGGSNLIDISVAFSLLPTAREKSEGNRPVLVLGNQEGVSVKVTDAQGHQWQQLYTMDEARDMLEGIEDGEALLYRLQGGNLVVKAGRVKDLFSVCRENLRRVVQQMAEVRGWFQNDSEDAYYRSNDVAQFAVPGVISFNGGKDKKNSDDSSQPSGGKQGSSSQAHSGISTTSLSNGMSNGSGGDQPDDEQSGKKLKSLCEESSISEPELCEDDMQSTESGFEQFSQDLLQSLEEVRLDLYSPERLMCKLEKQYIDFLQNIKTDWKNARKRGQLEKEMASLQSSGPLDIRGMAKVKKIKKQLEKIKRNDCFDFSDKTLQHILSGCCRPELAELIPKDMLDMIRNWLESPDSVLQPSRRNLIKVMASSEQLRKVIQQNHLLSKGDIYYMNGVVFSQGATISFGSEMSYDIFDYSGMSFSQAVFVNMAFDVVKCNAGDFSFADFTGSLIVNCDFQDSNFSGACFSKCDIRYTNFDKATLSGINFSAIQRLLYIHSPDHDETVDLLCYELDQYCARCEDHLSGPVIKVKVCMLLGMKRFEVVEKFCNELIERHAVDAEIFYKYIQALINLAEKCECGFEKNAFLRKIIDVCEVVWRSTRDLLEQEYYTHEWFYHRALVALSAMDSSYDWQALVEEIESKKPGVNTFLYMVDVLLDKQEYEWVWRCLSKVLNGIPSCKKNRKFLRLACQEILSVLMSTDMQYLDTAEYLLDEAIYIACDTQDGGNTNIASKIENKANIFSAYFYKLKLLMYKGDKKQVAKHIFRMNEHIPGVLELFTVSDYEKTQVFRKDAWCFREIIDEVRAARLTLSDIDEMALLFGDLSADKARPQIITDILKGGIPALAPRKKVW